MWIFEYIGLEIVRDSGLLGSPSPPTSSFFFLTVFTRGQTYTWTWWAELETDCCLHLNFQGDITAGTQGRPPSYSDMVSRPHYPKSGSFILVYMSLCLVLILSPRHTHFSHWLLWKSFTPKVQIKTEWGAWASQEVWKISALNEFIWFHLHLLSPLAVSTLFEWRFLLMPKNKHVVSYTDIKNNFWHFIASIGTIAKNILYFVLEEIILSHMWRKRGWGEILVQPTGPERQERVSQAGEAFGWSDRENAKLLELKEKPVHWCLSPDSRHWIGGMTASTFAHLTCQLNFFGLTS